jgi:glutathione S-transferase
MNRVMADYLLTSFDLCPFVQRSVIALNEKGVPHDIRYIDLANKPDWFLEISPFGKVPVLTVGDTHIFESQVINEYIEETTPGALHPADPLRRAHNRAWIEFASGLLMTAYGVEIAADEETARAKAKKVREDLARVEAQIVGPLFNGEAFSLVDAAAAPMLQRLVWYQDVEPSLAFFEGLPKVTAWRDALLARPSVRDSLVPDIVDRFHASLEKRAGERWLAGRFSG